jgi:hypothetical protein
MASFDLGRRFGLIFIASNSLLHLHSADDIIRCFQYNWPRKLDHELRCSVSFRSSEEVQPHGQEEAPV